MNTKRASYSTAEAARVLAVHPSTVRRYANAKLLTPTRSARGHRRYDRDQVDDLARRTGQH